MYSKLDAHAEALGGRRLGGLYYRTRHMAVKAEPETGWMEMPAGIGNKAKAPRR